MLKKLTFDSDEEVNEFLKTKPDDCYVIKFIIFANPFTKQIQQHYLVSYHPVARGGEHLHRGVPGNAH